MPQTAKDRELGTYTSKELRAMSDGKNIRPKVIPGTQDTGSPLGALARGHIAAGTTNRTGVAGRDTVKDNYNVARLSDSQMANKYTAEQTAKMRSKLSARKQSATRGKAASGMLAMMAASQAIANRRAKK